MNYDEIDRQMARLGEIALQLAEQTRATSYLHMLISINVEHSNGKPRPKVSYSINTLGSGRDVAGATRLADAIEEFRRRSGWVDRQTQQALPRANVETFVDGQRVDPPKLTDEPDIPY
jgi:hypothetical protein